MMKDLQDNQQKYTPSPADILALERTVMANERTFLAYIRTSLSLFIPGVAGVQLADSLLLEVVSFLFIPLGITVFILGVYRFLKKRKQSREVIEKRMM